jgi:hypothetical protein
MFAASLALATLPACSDDTGVFPRHDGGPVVLTTNVVVVNTDYSVSSISFLDGDGDLLMDGCLNSGSGGPGMTMTLSGDVVLPTQVPAGGPIPVVDRGNATITWLDVASCAVLGQLAVGTGFKSNPQDVVTLSASRAYVVRQDPNPLPTAALDDFDEGNDVLVIDPAQAKIVSRIDLGPFAPAGVLPRAHRALLIDGKVYVSLNAISVDYKSYGDGRVVVIDPATDQVTGVIDIPGVKNCGAMTYAAAMHRLFVACGGAYGDPVGQAATSAIVAIDVGQTPPIVVAQVAATTVGTAPFSNLTVAAADGSTALGVAVGDFTGTPPDSLWSLPLDGKAPTKVFDSSEGFALGAVLYDSEHQRVLATDGTMASPAYLRMFDGAAGVFTAGKTVKTNPAQKLPPRALAFY